MQKHRAKSRISIFESQFILNKISKKKQGDPNYFEQFKDVLKPRLTIHQSFMIKHVQVGQRFISNVRLHELCKREHQNKKNAKRKRKKKRSKKNKSKQKSSTHSEALEMSSKPSKVEKKEEKSELVQHQEEQKAKDQDVEDEKDGFSNEPGGIYVAPPKYSCGDRIINKPAAPPNHLFNIHVKVGEGERDHDEYGNVLNENDEGAIRENDEDDDWTPQEYAPPPRQLGK